MAAVAGAVIGAAASIFGASSSAKAAKQAAEAQREAANLQTLVARELHAHWKSHYQQCDIAAINEICAEPKYEPQYAVTAGRTRTEVLRNFARARDQARRAADVYCVGANAQLCNFMAGIEALALTDAVNFGYRWEENYALQRNQLRLERLYNWLGLGRNLINQSGAAASLAAQIQRSLGAQAGAAANGWLQTAGYLLSERGQNALGQIFGRIGQLFGQDNAPTRAPRLDDWSGSDWGASFTAPSSTQDTGMMGSSDAGTGGARMDDWSGAPGYAAPDATTGVGWEQFNP